MRLLKAPGIAGALHSICILREGILDLNARYHRLANSPQSKYAQWCMDAPVTIRDIALSLKMHHSTVSRALRNDPRIPEKTRERVQQKAKELDYAPNPMLSALMTYRLKKAPKGFRGVLGWMTNYPTRDGWHQHEKIGYFEGAKRHAKLVGYELESFWLREPGMTNRRFSQILNARNIQGLLFIPQPRSRAHFRLEWDKFSTLTFGTTFSRPEFRMVDNDHFNSMAILMRQLKRLGYNRPGFACHPRVNESTNRHWLAAFWAFQSLPVEKQIPAYLARDWNKSTFKQWFLTHRPDVVVSHALEVLEWLDEMRVRIPDDVGFASAARHGTPDHCSGIDENSELGGEAAVNVIADMIRRGERGIPDAPITTLIPGRWVDGTSLRSARP